MLINNPTLVATLAQLHDDYERALVANDVAALDAFFWAAPGVVRYGVADQQYGAESLHQYRQAYTPTFTARRLLRREITVFAADCASIMSEIEIVVGGQPGLTRQSQTWVQLPGQGWRIVAAHVSKPLESGWSRYVSSAALALNLRLDPAHRPGVEANLQRIAELATPLLTFALPDDVEPAVHFSA